MTKGTIIVLAANCVIALIGVLQGVDWVHVVGSATAGIVVAILAALNAGAHALTGSDGLSLGQGGTNSSPPQAKRP